MVEVREPATASTLSASTPREKCTDQAAGNPSASALHACCATCSGEIGAPRTSPPTFIAIRTEPASGFAPLIGMSWPDEPLADLCPAAYGLAVVRRPGGYPGDRGRRD